MKWQMLVATALITIAVPNTSSAQQNLSKEQLLERIVGQAARLSVT
jgi:hypothetical protein